MGCDKTQLELWEQVIEGPLKKLVDNPKAKAYGATDQATFEWLWHKATKKPWDQGGTYPGSITKNDVKRFTRLSKEYIGNLGKNKNWFQRHMWLPKRLAGNSPGGEKFIEALGEASSYHQRQMKEGATHVSKMIEGLYTMFGDKESPIIQQFGRELTAKEYQKFQTIEKRLEAAEYGTPEFQKVYKELIDATGWKLPNNRSLLGEIVQRYQGLMDFTQQPTTRNEHNIVQEWRTLRAESMKNLLNGAIAARRTIEAFNNPVEKQYLVKAIDKLQEKIDALLIQSKVDMKSIKSQADAEGWKVEWTNGLEVYDPSTGRTEKYRTFDSSAGEFVVGLKHKQYFPEYVIELSNIMKNVTDFALNKNRSEWKDMSPEALMQAVEEGVSPEKITKRLEKAGDDNKYHSLDPIFYLNKYVNDVANFNFRTRVNHAYVLGTRDLVKTLRKHNLSKDKYSTDVGDYAHEMIDILNEIRESALVSNRGQMNEMDHIVRIINGFEYISKLGFSARSGVKNKGQGLFNFFKYGRKGWVTQNKFFNETSGESTTDYQSPTNTARMENQLRRLGFLYGEKAEAKDIQMSNLAASTGGSLDARIVPEGFSVNKSGELIHAPKKSVAERAAGKVADLAEKSSKITVLGKWSSQQNAENANRLNTFKYEFAHAFLREKQRFQYWKEKLSTSEKEATIEQIYNAMERSAGNQAQEMVKTLHYDYDNWAKAKFLQSKKGKVIGQFQHFKFAFFDMQYNMMRNAVRDAKDLIVIDINPITGKKELNPHFSEVFRVMAGYSIGAGLFGLVTDFDIGGLFSSVGHSFGLTGEVEDYEDRESAQRTGIVENPIVEEASKLMSYLGADSEADDDVYGNKKYGSYYGKNPITANLGPFVSDLLTVAELMDWWNQTDEEYEERKGLAMDTSDPDWWYKMARIINIQGARTAWHTIPALINKDLKKAARIELGTYKPQWLIGGMPATKFGDEYIRGPAKELYNKVPFLPEIKTRKKKKGRPLTRQEQRQQVLRSLNNF